MAAERTAALGGGDLEARRVVQDGSPRVHDTARTPAGKTVVVVIGRNEGPRLVPSLESALKVEVPVVYADSGSTDGSEERARALGCHVVVLDGSRPYSAARGRNEGLARAIALVPDAEYVQFLDGDAVLRPDWVTRALEELAAVPDACAVMGRLREARPEESIYNQICELEWNLPQGDAHCFGGIVFARIRALRQVGGFDESLVAGEEPELSQRLRQAGWRIRSLAHEMAVHDAGIERFGQWWRRAYRSGHAYAEVFSRGRGLRDRFGLRQSLRVWCWAFLLPVAGGAGAFLHGSWPVLAGGLYTLQVGRVYLGRRQQGHGARIAFFYAATWLPSMVAQWFGQCRYLLGRLTGRRTRLIEYKGASGPTDSEGCKQG